MLLANIMSRSEHTSNVEMWGRKVSENMKSRGQIMSEPTRAYLPAASRDWLLPLYDPFVRLLGGNAAHGALIEQGDLRPSQRILEVGCGTGTLAVRIKRLQANVEVV